jgi:hypothetical protein
MIQLMEPDLDTFLRKGCNRGESRVYKIARRAERVDLRTDL